MRRMIRIGIYGKCVHPTCTTLAFLGWILFLVVPDLRIFVSNLWFTFVLVFWIRAEKAFFLNQRSRLEVKKPEPV